MRWKGSHFGVVPSQVRTSTPPSSADTVIVELPPGSSELPGTRARVAEEEHESRLREKLISRPLTPRWSLCTLEPATMPPPALTTAKNVTPLGPGGPTGPRCPLSDARAFSEMSPR